LRLYDFHDSGNGYKVRLLLAMLGTACDYVEMDILAGETRTPAFLEKNPNGRIPVLELDDGACLAESDAILSIWLKTRRFCRATVWTAPGCCNGCSSSSTAMSPTSPSPASG
jgi:glutathione S-transferase